MASNPTPPSNASPMLQSRRAYQGATTVGISIPLLNNTTEIIGTEREALRARQTFYQTKAGAMTALCALVSAAVAA